MAFKPTMVAGRPFRSSFDPNSYEDISLALAELQAANDPNAQSAALELGASASPRSFYTPAGGLGHEPPPPVRRPTPGWHPPSERGLIEELTPWSPVNVLHGASSPEGAEAEEVVINPPAYKVENTPFVDNAQYYSPKGLTAERIKEAIDWFSGLDPVTRQAAFADMYINESGKFSDVNAKRFAGANMSYFSPSVGTQREPVNQFDAYGNYLYGLIGTAIGIPAGELRSMADLFQSGGKLKDDPFDRPHVTAGIQAGHAYAATGDTSLLPRLRIPGSTP